MIVGTVLSAIFYLIRFYAKFLSKKLNVADCKLLRKQGAVNPETTTNAFLDLTIVSFVRLQSFSFIRDSHRLTFALSHCCGFTSTTALS